MGIMVDDFPFVVLEIMVRMVENTLSQLSIVGWFFVTLLLVVGSLC